MACELTFEHYKSIMKDALNRGYEISSYDCYANKISSGKIIVLRHDVDSKLDKSLHCAEIERRLGIRSTYFIRSYAEDYNLSDPLVRYKLDLLHQYGHEIGLHYETGNLMRSDNDDPEAIFLDEKRRLGNACNIDVVSATSHSDKSSRRWIRSSKSTVKKSFMSRMKKTIPHGPKALLKSLIESFEVRGIKTPLYSVINGTRDDLFTVIDKCRVGILYQSWDEELCRGFVHLMEGRGQWIPSCPCKLIGRYDRLMITTHPEHWTE